jgi:tyrosyl-tRNA synthetase
MAEIKLLQAKVASGETHPMKLKKELAARIVTDFHSAAEAKTAQENWERQFQKSEVPQDIPFVSIPVADVYVKNVELMQGPTAPYYPLFELNKVKPGDFLPLLRLDKILTVTKLSSSNAEAARKLKERAVRINGNVVAINHVAALLPVEFTLNLGRHWRKVRIA